MKSVFIYMFWLAITVIPCIGYWYVGLCIVVTNTLNMLVNFQNYKCHIKQEILDKKIKVKK